MIEPERLDYPLTDDSLVWDVGAFHLEFSEAIVHRFGCKVMAFEPVPLFWEDIRERNDVFWTLIELFDFGLAERDCEQAIPAAGDRTSAYVEAASDPLYHPGPLLPARFRDVVGFLDEHAIAEVDLAKINIEGGEYALLRRLIDAGYIDRFRHLQVQFHTFMPEFGELYLALKRDMERTHTLSWRWPWRWESWARK